MSRDLRNSDEFSLSSLSPSQAPNLGVVVYQLKHCANYFMTIYESRKLHLRKLEGLTELSTEDLKQFAGSSSTEKMSSQQRQQMAKKRLNQIIAANYKELQSYSYIIENSLFLLWRHLEYYLIHCIPVDQRQSIYQSQSKRQHQIRRLQDLMGVPQTVADTNQNAMSPAPSLDLDDTRRGVSQQDIDALKQMAVSVLSESLFKKILEINQTFCRERSHYGFVEAVIRRIRRLLRLHTGS